MNRNFISQSAGLAPQAHSRRAWMVLGFLLGAATAFGQRAEDLRLTVGKSVVIDYPSDIRQISTSSPEIVDASPVTTREILLHGKGLGNATLVVWSKTGERTFYNVTVDLNLDSLRKILKDSFPNEQIVPQSSRDSLTLNGKVSTKDVADRVIALASTFAKTVVNNMDLATPPVEKQVLLRVRFAELDRTKSEQYGINWFSQAGQTGFYASTQQSGIGSSTTGGPAAQNTLSVASALNIFAFDPKLNLGAFLQALQTEDILQILAEPNLVTTNGKEAYFLVGGEFPVPVLQGGGNAGSVTVQFKEFGIRLRFTPVITGNRTIKLHLTQEVSTLDAADGVTFNGFGDSRDFNPARRNRRGTGRGAKFRGGRTPRQPRYGKFQQAAVPGRYPGAGRSFQEQDRKEIAYRSGDAGHSGSDAAAGADRSTPRDRLPQGFPGAPDAGRYAERQS